MATSYEGFDEVLALQEKERRKKMKCDKKGHKRRALIYGIDKDGKSFTAGEYCKRCKKIFRTTEEDGWVEPDLINAIVVPVGVFQSMIWGK